MSKTASHRLGAAAPLNFVAGLTLLLWLLHYIRSVSAQDGFLSLDCGSRRNSTVKGLFWENDEPFVQGGKTGLIQENGSPPYLPRYLRTLRFFPPEPEYRKYSMSCYRLPVKRTQKYLIRAAFSYGNYDNKNSPPTFELGVGLAKVATVQTTLNGAVEYEVILMSRRSNLPVCLYQVEAESIPFISSLEVRPLDNSMYATQLQTTALIKFLRVNFGSITTRTLRWPDDRFDRKWLTDAAVTLSSQPNLEKNSTNELISTSPSEVAPDRPPDLVLRTAVALKSPGETVISLSLPYSSTAAVPYIAAYFSNIFDTSDRDLSVHVNNYLGVTVHTEPLAATELIMNDLPEFSGSFSLNITDGSQEVAFINGLEVYTTLDTIDTYDPDRKALETVQGTFPQLRKYIGDPCQPITWDWINCTERESSGNKTLRITAIFLSSRNLTGTIPAAIADLNLQDLWLDGNELQGLIPDLASVQNLQTLHLQNNRLTGPLSEHLALLELKELYVQNNDLGGAIPRDLSNKQGLDLRIDGNPELCFANGTCGIPHLQRVAEPPKINDNPKNKKVSRVLVVVGGAVGAALAVIVCLCMLVYCCCIRKSHEGGMDLKFDKPSLKGCWQRGGCSTCFRSEPPHMSHLNSIGVNISKASANGLHSSNRGTSETSQYVATTDAFREAQTFRPVELKKATQNYISKIGEGGFGPVYYGRLPNNMEIAVKVRSNHSRQGAREFSTEVEILSRAKHPNLVALIGHCQETKDYMLIYEYLSGGTLQEHLYGLFSEQPLDWKTRLKIAVDAAKGLEYLHNDCFPTIIHRDVKSSNILLTANFDAKVADFGLSKFLEGQAAHVSTIVKGTSGYLDPDYVLVCYVGLSEFKVERYGTDGLNVANKLDKNVALVARYFETQRLTHKSDVYSFGTVLLEIITSREPLNTKLPRDQWRLSDWTRKHLLQGDLEKVVDPGLKGLYNEQSMWKVAELAMTCVEPRSIHRPTMNEVVTELQCAVEIEAEGHTILTLPIAYHREDPYLLEPGRQYHSQSFGRLSNASAKLSYSLPADIKDKIWT